MKKNLKVFIIKKDLIEVMKRLRTMRFMVLTKILAIFLSIPLTNTMITVEDIDTGISLVAGIKEWE